MIFLSITFLIYGLYNCNCNKNKSYEKFESNNNNPIFLNVINKNMNNIQNISNFNKKRENFIDINKIIPEDINTLNNTINNILLGKDKNGNIITYDIDNINRRLNDVKKELNNFLNQQQIEHQNIINSIDNSIGNLENTSNTLLLQKANIALLEGNQTLFNDIAIITPTPEPTPSGESFENVNQPLPYNNNLISNNLLPLNENIKNIEPHKIITKQNKNLFNNLPKSIKINDFQRCQPEWQLEWVENLKQITI